MIWFLRARGNDDGYVMIHPGDDTPVISREPGFALAAFLTEAAARAFAGYHMILADPVTVAPAAPAAPDSPECGVCGSAQRSPGCCGVCPPLGAVLRLVSKPATVGVMTSRGVFFEGDFYPFSPAVFEPMEY